VGESYVFDTAGPLPQSECGVRYILVGVDRYSKYHTVSFAHDKGTAADQMITILRQCAAKHNRKAATLFVDNAKELISAKVSQYCRDSGTELMPRVPYTPQHTAEAERFIRTLMETARSLLYNAGLPKAFWPDASRAACDILNRTLLVEREGVEGASDPTAMLKYTPYQLHNKGNKPNVSRMYVFGCDADIHTPAELVGDAVDPRGRLCVLLGWIEDKKGWRYYDPERMQFGYSRDVKAYENEFTAAKRCHEQGVDVNAPDYYADLTVHNEIELLRQINQQQAKNAPAQDTARPSTAAAPAPLPGGVAPSAPSVNSDPTDSLAKAQQGDATGGPVTRRSTRARKVTNRLGMTSPGDIGTFALLTEEVPTTLPDCDDDEELDNLTMLAELAKANVFVGAALPAAVLTPASWDEAMKHPGWREADEKEIKALQDNGTWEFVKITAGMHLLDTKRVYKVKLNADGTVERYKARLTVRGFRQRAGIDYTDTAAPTLSMNTMRAVLAFATALDYELYQLDVSNAFLNAKVTENIFVKCPAGIVCPPGHCLRLLKALYGIHQGPLVWNLEIHDTLTKDLGYTQSLNDRCLYWKRSKSGRIMLIPLFVDDMFPACHTADKDEMVDDLLKIKRKYKVKASPQAHLVLGLRIRRDRAEKKMWVDQEVYTRRLLQDYGFVNCQAMATPLPAALLGDNALPMPNSMIRKDNMRQIVGALTYLAMGTRPDIAYAVNVLARDAANPTNATCHHAAHLMRYLYGTVNWGLCYGGRPGRVNLRGWCDASFAPAQPDGTRRSTTGALIEWNGGPIYWESKRQPCTAQSSAEAEYIAANTVVRNLVWLRRLVKEMRGEDRLLVTTQVYTDSQAAMSMATNPAVGLQPKTRHVSTRYWFVNERINDGEVKMRFIAGEDMLADMLTKSLPKPKHIKHRAACMNTVPPLPNARSAEIITAFVGNIATCRVRQVLQG
jgi:hypothetical protein